MAPIRSKPPHPTIRINGIRRGQGGRTVAFGRVEVEADAVDPRVFEANVRAGHFLELNFAPDSRVFKNLVYKIDSEKELHMVLSPLVFFHNYLELNYQAQAVSILHKI